MEILVIASIVTHLPSIGGESYNAILRGNFMERRIATSVSFRRSSAVASSTSLLKSIFSFWLGTGNWKTGCGGKRSKGNAELDSVFRLGDDPPFPAHSHSGHAVPKANRRFKLIFTHWMMKSACSVSKGTISGRLKEFTSWTLVSLQSSCCRGGMFTYQIWHLSYIATLLTYWPVAVASFSVCSSLYPSLLRGKRPGSPLASPV